MNWFGPELGRKGAGGDDLRLRSQQQPAKLALVVVAEFEAAVEQQAHVCVLDRRFLGLPEAQMTGHPQMHDQPFGTGTVGARGLMPPGSGGPWGATLHVHRRYLPRRRTDVVARATQRRTELAAVLI